MARAKVPARRNIENALRRYGFVRIAGVDEVGRGCLAGPVMAGAVILAPGATHRRAGGLEDPDRAGPGAAYSMKSRAKRRVGVISVDPDEIDRINIHQATLRAMQRAVLALAPLPDAVLVDAFRIPSICPWPSAGDRRRPAVRGHCRRVHRGQGHPGPVDAEPCTPLIHGTGSTDIRAMPPLTILRPWHGLAIPPQHRRSFRPPTLFDTID